MITEKELLSAIAECQGARNPNAGTCVKLASYFTILDHMFSKPEEAQAEAVAQSFASFPTGLIQYNGDTEFSEIIDGKPMQDVLTVIDELMSTLQVINPRLYASVLRKLETAG